MPHIYSTLSSDNEYTDYVPAENGARAVHKMVRIKGGANVAQPLNLLVNQNLTPVGHATKVTDEDLEFLRANPVFKLHEKNGFVKVVESSKEEKVEKAVKDMEKQDESAPLTDADYDAKNTKARAKGAAPKTGKVV